MAKKVGMVVDGKVVIRVDSGDGADVVWFNDGTGEIYPWRRAAESEWR